MTQGTNNQYIQAKSEKHQNDAFQKFRNTAAKVVNGQNQYEKKEQLDGNHQIAKGDTRAAIAKSHNISQYEVQKAVEFGRGLDAAEKVSPGIKEAVLSGRIKAPTTKEKPARSVSRKSLDKFVAT